jgi:hypothetical protein
MMQDVHISQVRVGDSLYFEGNYIGTVRKIVPVASQSARLDETDHQRRDWDDEHDFIPFKRRQQKACREERNTYSQRCAGYTVFISLSPPTARYFGSNCMVQIHVPDQAAAA